MATGAGLAIDGAPQWTRARDAGRVAWVDAARGIAILLVVFGHAAGGLIDSMRPGSVPDLRHVFLGIYTFHMPIFFFLAGLFVERRLRRGLAPFLNKLMTTIAWPYFLWSFVQFSLIYALGSLVNHPASNYWHTIAALGWSPVSQFWFLHALFLIHLLGMLAWRIGGARAVLVAALTVKIVALFVPSTPVLSLAAGNAPYYALGMVVGLERMSLLLARTSLPVAAILLVAAGGTITLLSANADALQPFIPIETASSAGIAKVAWMPFMLPAALLGGAALLTSGYGLSRLSDRFAGATEFLGTMTMPIYLLHVLFIAGTRILLSKLLGVDGLEILPLLIGVGVAGPLFVRHLSDRLKLTAILGLG